jgi:hypothetical protein
MTLPFVDGLGFKQVIPIINNMINPKVFHKIDECLSDLIIVFEVTKLIVR